MNAGANATNYALTGLLPSTTYQWQIATLCQNSPQVISTFSTVKTFTTAAALVATANDTKKSGYSASLSPNPAISNAILKWDGAEGNIVITLTDLSGNVQWKKTITDKQVNIPLANLANSTYMITVQDSKTNTYAGESSINFTNNRYRNKPYSGYLLRS